MLNSVTTPFKIFGLIFLIVAALCLTYVWAELAYRWTLYISYGSRPSLNHVDESYFSIIPATARIGASCAVVALAFAVRLHYRKLLFVVAILAISGPLATRVLDYYHRSLVLVTYSEFVDVYIEGPESLSGGSIQPAVKIPPY